MMLLCKEMLMEMRNGIAVQEFSLEGFPGAQHLGKILFLVHLLAYLAPTAGNTLIVTITCADSRLQTPMYFFLSIFSFTESCLISAIIPKLLVIFLLGKQTISFAACLTQAFVLVFLGAAGFLLTAVLSLDQYLAIYKLLDYTTIMTLSTCCLLVTACCAWSSLLRLVWWWRCRSYPSAASKASLISSVTLAPWSISPALTPNLKYMPLSLLCVSFWHPSSYPSSRKQHSSHNHASPISQGATKSFLHLLLSPHCPLPDVWQQHLYIRETKASEQAGFQQGGCPCEHGSDPTAEPCHLHSEEQAGPPGSEK